MYDYLTIADLKGKVLSDVNNTGSEIVFNTSALDWPKQDDAVYALTHIQDCCESVYVEDVIGDLKDLIGSPILMAEEVSNEGEEPKCPTEYQDDSHTWTFYKLATIKGYVTIRFYGSSNGYYSEGVDFVKRS